MAMRDASLIRLAETLRGGDNARQKRPLAETSMMNNLTIEQILQQLRDDQSFREQFVANREHVLSQQTGLDESVRLALRTLDIGAFLTACASVGNNNAVQPIA